MISCKIVPVLVKYRFEKLSLSKETLVFISRGYIFFKILSHPEYRDKVVEMATITMVDRMQMLARLAAFCFMR